MSILNTFTFDSTDELSYDTSKIEVITSVDDETGSNPFSFSGSVGTFAFVASGSPFVSSSGEVLSFDLGEVRKLKDITISQEGSGYAVSYRINGGVSSSNEMTLVNVSGSVNSGNIYHAFSNSLELRYLDLVVFQVPENVTTYVINSVSGTANPPITEAVIAPQSVETITATSNVEPVENLYDGSASTFWQSNNSYPQEVVFKLRTQQNLSKFEYVSEDNSTYPTAYTISTSLDGTTYTQIHSASSITATSGSITFTPVQTAKYVKWNITAGNSNKVRIREVSLFNKSYEQIDLNEIRLKRTIADVMALVPSLNASTSNGTNVVSNLIAGVAGYWQSASSMGLSNGFYTGSENITFTFTTKTTIDSLVMNGYLDDGMPVDFILQGSNDNATFTTIYEVIGNSQKDYTIKFADDVDNTYIYYKLVFTKSTDAFVKLNEVKFNTRSYPTSASVSLPTLMVDKITGISVTTSNIDLINRDIKYVIGINNRNYWYNGQAFVQSNLTFLQANTLIDLNANFEKLTLDANSKISIVAVMSADGVSTPKITSASLTTKNLPNAAFVPANQIRIKGYIAGHVGKPLEMTLSLKRPVKIDGQIVAYSANVIKSDSQGYFDFSLPCTETAVPAKEKFVVVIQPLNYRVERYTPNQTDIDLATWIGGSF